MGKYDPSPTVAAGLIRLVRAKAGLTQGELAALAGLTQQAVSAYETGRKEPTIPSLLRLVRAAGYELTFQLVPGDDHDESLEHYLAKLPPDVRARVEDDQRKRVGDARLKRVRGK